MRRRTRDVFELGEEQLLDEPAVELAEPEGPPVPPPTGGSATEATGPEEPRAAKATRTRPRVPSLDRLPAKRHLVAGALAALTVGASAFVGVRHALEGDAVAPVAGSGNERAGKGDRANTRGRDGARAGTNRSKRRSRKAMEPGAGANGASQEESADVPREATPGQDVAPPAGAGSPSPPSSPPIEPIEDATPAQVRREFGL